MANGRFNLWRSIPLPRGPERRLVAYRWLLVATGLYTIAITWNVWQVRSAPGWEPWPAAMPNFYSTWHDAPSPSELAPMLPVWEWLPQFDVGWLLAGSLLLVLVRPWAGIAAYTAVLAAGILMDVMRLQPPCLIMFLLIGTMPGRNWHFLGRVWVVTFWFWVGLHKLLIDLIKPSFERGFTTHIIPEDLKNNLTRWGIVSPDLLPSDLWTVGYLLGWGVALAEIGLAALCVFPQTRRAAGWLALAMHLGIAVFHCHSLKSSVLAWNMGLAFAGLALIAPWRETVWASFKQASLAARGAAVFLAIYPAGYYLEWMSGYLAHCIYVPNTPFAELYRPGEGSSFVPFLPYEIVNFPLPPGQGISEYYFEKFRRPGDVMRISDPRPWSVARGRGRRVITDEGAFSSGEPWRYTYPDGKISAQGDLLAGQKQGLWTQWHANGTIAAKGLMIDDQKHGIWMQWYEDGGRQSCGGFDHGRRDGKWELWYADGRPESVRHYDQGAKAGHWVFWYPDGRKAMEGDYQADAMEGTWKFWNTDGELTEKEFRRGELVAE